MSKTVLFTFTKSAFILILFLREQSKIFLGSSFLRAEKIHQMSFLPSVILAFKDHRFTSLIHLRLWSPSHIFQLKSVQDRPEHQNMSLCESVVPLPTPHQIHGSKNHTVARLRANFNLHFEARKLTVACFPLLPLILLLPLAPPPPGSRALPPVLPSTPPRPSFSLCLHHGGLGPRSGSTFPLRQVHQAT